VLTFFGVDAEGGEGETKEEEMEVEGEIE